MCLLGLKKCPRGLPVSVQISFHLTECSQKGFGLHYKVGKENPLLCLVVLWWQRKLSAQQGLSSWKVLFSKPWNLNPHFIKWEGMSKSPERVTRSIFRTRDEVFWLLNSRGEGVRHICDHHAPPDSEWPLVHSAAHGKPPAVWLLGSRAQIQVL